MAHASETLVELEGLEKSYRRGWFRNAPPALHSVTFRVQRGEVFGLLGPNGAGKTTIIKILLGIVRATGGTARLLGYPAGDQRGRRKVGYLPEHLQIPAHQTARTALEYYGRSAACPMPTSGAAAMNCFRASAWQDAARSRSSGSPRACASGWGSPRPCCTSPTW